MRHKSQGGFKRLLSGVGLMPAIGAELPSQADSLNDWERGMWTLGRRARRAAHCSKKKAAREGRP